MNVLAYFALAVLLLLSVGAFFIAITSTDLFFAGIATLLMIAVFLILSHLGVFREWKYRRKDKELQKYLNMKD